MKEACEVDSNVELHKNREIVFFNSTDLSDLNSGLFFNSSVVL